MPDFTQTIFLGATVATYGTTIGWNGESTELSCTLVEDDGQVFTKQQVGTPATFQFGNFRFRGLIQSWSEKRSTSQNPIYDVRLVDPSEILDGTHVIASQYNGTIFGINNIINVFGFYEQVAFGFSGENEAGMPWEHSNPGIPDLKTGVELIVNSAALGPFGGPLKFNDVQYKVDLSRLPKPPDFFRLGGGQAFTLLDAIKQVCLGTGHDFFFELTDDNIIVVRVVNRQNAIADLTKVQQFVNEKLAEKIVSSSSVGRESRNELQTSFIAGGPRTFLRKLQAIPYWGMSVDDTFITGEEPVLNATPILEILGTPYYPTDLVEIRAAMCNQLSWQEYVVNNKPALATYLGLRRRYSPEKMTQFQSVMMSVNADVDRASQFNDVGNYHAQIEEVYKFVLKAGEDYYGKQFLVELPFITLKVESDTFRFVTNEEYATGGAFEGSQPVSGLAALLFTNDKGMWGPLARMTNASAARMVDLLNGTDSIVKNNEIYIKINTDGNILFKDGSPPAMIIGLPNAIYEHAESFPFAVGVNDIANIMALDGAALQQVAKNRVGGPTHLCLHPRAGYPNEVYIPFISNALVYGPFVSSRDNRGGKVQFTSDQSLVPENYGGFAALAAVGQALADAETTSLTEVEAGSVELAGMPLISLGDALIAGGPIVTNISVRVVPGPEGIRTNYGMQTYTPRFGFPKSFISFLQRQVKAQELQRTALRAALEKSLNQSKADVQRRLELFKNSYPGVNQTSPHQIFQTRVREIDTNVLISDMSTCTAEEAEANARAGTPEYLDVGYCSLDGLFRGFSTQTSYTGKLPHYEPLDDIAFSGGLNFQKLDPFIDGHDISVAAGGTEYQWQAEGTTDIRSIALRGPMVMAGWGYNFGMGLFSGSPTDPKAPDQYLSADYLTKVSEWKVGPVDLMWDEARKVWTSHDIMFGVSIGAIAPGSSGPVIILKGSSKSADETDTSVLVHNFYSTEVPSDTKLQFGFVAHLNKFLVISVDCEP